MTYALSKSCVLAEIIDFIRTFSVEPDFDWNTFFAKFWPWFSSTMKRLPATIFTLCEVIKHSSGIPESEIDPFIIHIFLTGLRNALFEINYESPKFKEFLVILALIEKETDKDGKYTTIISNGQEQLTKFAQFVANTNHAAVIDIDRPTIGEYIQAVRNITALIGRSQGDLRAFNADISIKQKIVDELLVLVDDEVSFLW